VVGLGSFPLGWGPFGWSSRQSAERIETFELQTTVIAKKFMQTGNPEHNRGIVVATLNSGTRTSGAPHIAVILTNLLVAENNNLSGSENSTEIREVMSKSLSKSTKARRTLFSGPSFNNPGDFLLSHTVSRAVPSAPAGLTSVFGMGTGVTLPTKSPENFFGSGDPAGVLKSRNSWHFQGQSPRYGTF
jgi:hypothetical protein